mgnify:CR=1 FL=1
MSSETEDTKIGTVAYSEYRYLTVCKTCGVVDESVLSADEATQDPEPIEDDPGYLHYERTGHLVARLNWTIAPVDIQEMLEGDAEDLDWSRVAEWLKT